MIEETQARETILAVVSSGSVESLSLMEAGGRFLAGDHVAGVASPPFDNSQMDGYAVRAADAGETGKELRVIGEQPAGKDLGLKMGNGEAIRIFTGAPVPDGADAVVMQEDVDAGADGKTISIREPVAEGEFIRRAGADTCVGQVIARKGQELTPQRIGLLASQGISRLEVGSVPRVAVITTGDELVAPGREEPPGPGEIYDSNSAMLSGLLRRSGVREVRHWHAVDTREALREAIGAALEETDVVLLAGGVSVGARDFVQEVLVDAGVQIDFWRVRIKPGKPLLFGRREGVPVFGLPGNPVSGFVGYVLFVEPALRKWMGASEEAWGPCGVACEVGEEIRNPGDRPHYVRGRLGADDGRFRPSGLQQSHALYGLAETEVLLRVEAGAVLEEGVRGMAILV